MGTLGRLELTPPEDLEAGVQKLNVYGNAVNAVLGALNGPLPVAPHNGFRGEMPAEITSLDDERLGNLLNDVSQWCGFLEVETAKATAARAEAEATADFVRSRVRLAMKIDPETNKKLTVQDKNDMVEVDPRVVRATASLLYTETVYSLTKVLRDKAQRDWDTISRRITQRGQGIERMKRENNVGGVPSQASRSFRRPHP